MLYFAPMKAMFFSGLLVVSALTLTASPASLDDDSFFDMESISDARISPDGRSIVFSRSWSDRVKDQRRGNLWLVNSDGSRLRELTHGNWQDSNPVWSPDGSRIAFISNRDGTNQVHVLWVENGSVAQLTHVLDRPTDIAWSPDSSRIAFAMRVPDKTDILKIKLPDKPEKAEWAKPAVVIDRLAWRMDGIGPLAKSYQHVFTIDARTGGTPRQITSGQYDHRSPAWSKDGVRLYVSGLRKPEAEYLRRDTEIYEVTLKDLAIRPLTTRQGPEESPHVSPDGKWIVYSGYEERRLTRHIDDLSLMAADGSRKRVLASNLPSSPADVQWADDSSGVYYTVGERGTANVYFMPLSGAARKVTDGVHVLSGFTVSRGGTAAAVRSSFHEPGTLVRFDVSLPNKPVLRALVDVNSDVLENKPLGKAEEIWVTSKDGLKVQGWLIQPANFKPGEKYPLVLQIHGGPWSAYTVAFNWGWQHFAAKGYGTLYMNPRGSTGYGQEFVNGIQYSYPGKDFDDLMAGVDAAVAKGWVDDRNLFVCGISGGGVLTAWTVGHTDRFRAAASMRPVINWHSFVGTTDMAMWYDQFKKFPWEDPMEYAVRSPLHYVANVKTPTLVMTGEADLRTPMAQSEEFYRALKMLKKDTLLIRFPDEYHGFQRPSHNLANQLYLLAWFEKYRVKTGDARSSGQ